ncbi:EAL domain-containing protein [Agarivorans sp. MS3-6]
MKVITLFLVALGLVWLSLSLKPAQKIRMKTRDVGWTLLSLLITSFLLAYVASFLYVFSLQEFNNAYLAYGMLLASGGAFVFFVTRYSLISILEHEHQASCDRITNLKNRHSFTKSIEDLVENSISFYIMLIDLNGFKQFNDAFGHPFGDALLKQVANRISSVLPEHCQLYRVGGDEFAILGMDGGKPYLDNDIQTIQDLFSQTITVQNQKLSIGISIGICIYPCSIKSPYELIQQAEQALYSSKSSKGHWEIFSEDLNKNILEHLEIVNQLQHALEHDCFSLFYQPIINTSNNSMHGAEVLIRWPQNNGDFIPPDKFIPIAEQSTLIHDITCWVFRKAIEDLNVLNSSGFLGCLHINLSTKDLHNNRLIYCLEEAASQGKVDPKRIVFEVTETAMMTDIKQVVSVMKQLSRLGYTFSLDDFGTGYSSFPLLKELPLTQIKIDRSFVMDMCVDGSNRSIVDSMVFLAKSLGCSVVAEGVENDDTASLLRQMDCDYLQGYYFSKPLPLEMYLHLHTSSAASDI